MFSLIYAAMITYAINKGKNVDPNLASAFLCILIVAELVAMYMIMGG